MGVRLCQSNYRINTKKMRYVSSFLSVFSSLKKSSWGSETTSYFLVIICNVFSSLVWFLQPVKMSRMHVIVVVITNTYLIVLSDWHVCSTSSINNSSTIASFFFSTKKINLPWSNYVNKKAGHIIIILQICNAGESSTQQKYSSFSPGTSHPTWHRERERKKR